MHNNIVNDKTDIRQKEFKCVLLFLLITMYEVQIRTDKIPVLKSSLKNKKT